MNALLVWIRLNPVVFSIVIWPVLTGIVTFFFKPRTPEEYAAMNPRWAAFLKMLGGSGIDAPNILNGLKQFLTKDVATAAAYRAHREALGQPKPPSEPPPESG